MLRHSTGGGLLPCRWTSHAKIKAAPVPALQAGADVTRLQVLDPKP